MSCVGYLEFRDPKRVEVCEQACSDLGLKAKRSEYDSEWTQFTVRGLKEALTELGCRCNFKVYIKEVAA